MKPFLPPVSSNSFPLSTCFFQEFDGRRATFAEAKNLVNNYARQQGVIIPNRFESLLVNLQEDRFPEHYPQQEWSHHDQPLTANGRTTINEPDRVHYEAESRMNIEPQEEQFPFESVTSPAIHPRLSLHQRPTALQNANKHFSMNSQDLERTHLPIHPIAFSFKPQTPLPSYEILKQPYTVTQALPYNRNMTSFKPSIGVSGVLPKINFNKPVQTLNPIHSALPQFGSVVQSIAVERTNSIASTKYQTIPQMNLLASNLDAVQTQTISKKYVAKEEMRKIESPSMNSVTQQKQNKEFNVEGGEEDCYVSFRPNREYQKKTKLLLNKSQEKSEVDNSAMVEINSGAVMQTKVVQQGMNEENHATLLRTARETVSRDIAQRETVHRNILQKQTSYPQKDLVPQSLDQFRAGCEGSQSAPLFQNLDKQKRREDTEKSESVESRKSEMDPKEGKLPQRAPFANTLVAEALRKNTRVESAASVRQTGNQLCYFVSSREERQLNPAITAEILKHFGDDFLQTVS